ncbi:MAG: TSUP family transporter, partial [Candidatus Nanopelagicales bacterium]
LLVVAMKSFAGFAGYLLTFGGDSLVSLNPETQINWSVTLIVTVMAVIGALIGSRLVGKIHPDILRKSFGWFVLVMAVFILSQQIGAAVISYAQEGWLQGAEVIVAAALIIAAFTYVIMKPAKQSVVEIADFDEPIPDDDETAATS